MAGYWLKPDTGEWIQVLTTHDEWVRDKTNAEGLGLPDSAYREIMQHPPTALDEIRLVAVRHGLVRIREHRRHVSVQFMAEPHHVGLVLGAIPRALADMKIHPDTWLVVDNLLSNQRVSVALDELRTAMENGDSVFSA